MSRRRRLRANIQATRAQFDSAQERIQQRTGRNLLLAILIGLGLGAAVLFSLIFLRVLFIGFAAIMVALASYELVGALRKAHYRVPAIPSVIAAVAVMPAAYFAGPAGQLLALIIGIVFISLCRLLLPRTGGIGRGLTADIAAGAFVQVYVTFFASFAVLLAAEGAGTPWILSFVILVIVADTGAYVAGLNWGKHPMAPRISPKKTWEGAAGGAVSCLIAGALLAVFLLQQSVWFGLIFGAAIFLAATFGDLAESLIKRDLGVKDMSSWLPGHGGVLDRIDSMLPSAVVGYCFFLLSR